jgi:hypothetical protein
LREGTPDEQNMPGVICAAIYGAICVICGHFEPAAINGAICGPFELPLDLICTNMLK